MRRPSSAERPSSLEHDARARCRDQRRRTRSLRADAPAVPAVPQPDGRRCASDLRHPRGGDPDRAHRDPKRDARVRLDRSRRVERARSAHHGSGRHACGRLPRLDPARRLLQRAGARDPLARGVARAPPHPAGAAGGGAIQDFVLRAHLGLLPLTQAAARAGAGRVRGRHRLDARARQPHLCRAGDQGGGGGGGTDLDLRLSPVARQ